MVIGGIDTRDISVVVQGAADPRVTPLCLTSIRKHFPGAEIILSTWKGTNVNGLNYDCVLLNDDPGGYKDKFQNSFTNNTSRQLYSTQQGVCRATRRYILKIRSDLIILSARFLNDFEKYQKRIPKYCFFAHRVIFSSFFSKKYCSANGINQPLPFHLSDWLSFGLSDDIHYLYDIPLPVEPKNSWYLAEKPYFTNKIDCLHSSHRYAPEQYIFYEACRKKFPSIKFDHYMDYDRDNIEWYERLVANNCIILDPTDFRFICGKEGNGSDKYKQWTRKPDTIPETLARGLYSHLKFENDYFMYCCNEQETYV